MSAQQILPFLSTIVMAVFIIAVFRRYAERRGTHLLLWGIGLTMFGLGSFAEAYLTLAWNPWIFRIWYLFGAALNAAWLGQGTVYLLARRRAIAHGLFAALLLGSLLAAYLMLTTPLDASAYTTARPISEQYRAIMPPRAPIRFTTPFFNIYGLITLVGGALYSAYLLWRRQIFPNRVIGNVLIAAGALVVAAASTLTRLGFGQYLYLGELAAATLMFIGFLLATQRPAAAPAPQKA
ncbi:MAG: hypothetical protein ACK4OK_06800 [Thermoflexus sp.]